MSEAVRLPNSITSRMKPGDTYSPTQGDHDGHVVEVVSLDALRFNVLGHPLRSVMVRCLACLDSWTFMPDDDFPDGWPHAQSDGEADA